MGGRVVEGTGLENRQTRKRLEGSNPSPSAKSRAKLLKNSGYFLSLRLIPSLYPPSTQDPYSLRTSQLQNTK
jgi:hypothetical protein